ncbi:MAG TPA: TatD family hydrolase, partial [Stellaceae bacterium]|nr:TatD family hydrolase [Stellaceae bacterium]
MLVDSHCHLDYAKPEERGEILARARRAGVATLLTISTKLTEFPEVRGIAESDADVWCSVGVHPHEAAAEDATAATLV